PKVALIVCRVTMLEPVLFAGPPNRPDQPVFFRHRLMQVNPSGGARQRMRFAYFAVSSLSNTRVYPIPSKKPLG
ncbi:hypothetical protein JWR97_12300, partial [Pseudomonas cedrina subsp. fulgida]|nr:hypothetical protein [Pseudomonas cedrina subsp. fulgida]